MGQCNIKHIVSSIIVLLTIFQLSAQCWFSDLNSNFDDFSVEYQRLLKTTPDAYMAYKILYEDGSVILKDGFSDVKYITDYITDQNTDISKVVTEIQKAGGYKNWKTNHNVTGKLITDAERALLWGKSGSSFKKAKKTLEKSGLLDEFKASYPELDELEIISIYRYTASSKNLNNPLNAGQVLTGKLEVHQKMMNAALDKLKNTKSYDKLVFRGANLDESLVLSKYKNNIGKEITEEAFTSSSKLEKVADDFIEKFRDINKAQVKYFIQSKTGIDINDMSHYTKVVGENQAEILFKSGTKFRIESVEKNIEGIFEIVMREF